MSTNRPVQAQVVGRAVGVTGTKQNDKGYEDNPSFTCIYYNEKDPRVCVCGRDNLKCGAPAPVANLATTGGKAICFVLLGVPIIAIIIAIAMGEAKEDEWREKCAAIQTEKECNATAEGDFVCVWNSDVAPCKCSWNECVTMYEEKYCHEELGDRCNWNCPEVTNCHEEDCEDVMPCCEAKDSRAQSQQCANDDNSDDSGRLLLSTNNSKAESIVSE